MTMVRARSLADFFCFFFFPPGFSRQSKTFAQEVRAIVPLPKGTEVFYSYNLGLLDRAGRRKSLDRYQFVCNCELCALPDDFSNALDSKINQSFDTALYLSRFYKGEEDDPFRAIQTTAFLMSTIIRERLFFTYAHFFIPLQLFTVMGRPDLLQEVGKAVFRLFRRHLGSNGVGDGNASVEEVSLYIEDALSRFTPEAFSPTNRDRRLEALLEKTASNIVSDIQSLP
jgi:hypothetical protein